MTLYLDYRSPSVQYFDDVNNNLLFKKDNQNYINVLSVDQLNSLDNVSLLDIFLSKGNIVEPHYHQNAAELVFCTSGAANISFINPFTNEVSHYQITSGQAVNIPQGWWHWEIATADQTRLIAIFNAPVPEVILGSDLLRLTPSDVLAYTYCLNEAKVKDTLAPIQGPIFVGPPINCQTNQPHGTQTVNPQQPYQSQAFVPYQGQQAPYADHGEQAPYAEHRQQASYGQQVHYGQPAPFTQQAPYGQQASFGQQTSSNDKSHSRRKRKKRS